MFFNRMSRDVTLYPALHKQQGGGEVPEDVEERLDNLEGEIVYKQDSYVEQKAELYLGYMEVDNIDYDYATQYLLNHFNPDISSGACSAIRNGNFVGRNYDLKYDENYTVIIQRNPVNGYYSNVGCSSTVIQDKRAIPFCMLDGINEHHVFAELNILQAIDRKSTTTGTNPNGIDVPVLMIIRRILDSCVSVDDAISKITNDWNIITPSATEYATEYHLLIADESKSVIVEFIDNEPVFIEQFVDDKPISTNFYLYGYDGTHESLDEHAMGIERYTILSEGYDNAGTEEGMRDLMTSVLYTNSYSTTEDPIWYSEFSGNTEEFGDLTKDSTPEEYAPILSYVRNLFANRTRDGQTWITVHSCVYNIAERSFTIRVQETEDEYWFGVEPLGEKPAVNVDSDEATEIAIDNTITASSTGVPTSAAVIAYINSLGTVEGGNY